MLKIQFLSDIENVASRTGRRVRWYWSNSWPLSML